MDDLLALPAGSSHVLAISAQDDIPLRPASREEIEYRLSYGRRFGSTGKAHHLASVSTVRIAAQVLVDHLEQSGYVLTKKPSAGNTTPLAPGGSKPSDRGSPIWWRQDHAGEVPRDGGRDEMTR